jgi:3-methyladenine DNA glycosylase Mpg
VSYLNSNYSKHVHQGHQCLIYAAQQEGNNTEIYSRQYIGQCLFNISTETDPTEESTLVRAFMQIYKGPSIQTAQQNKQQHLSMMLHKT